MNRLVALVSSTWLALLFLIMAMPVYAAAPTITSFDPAFGKIGDIVSITGTGFTPASVARFNGKLVTQLTVNSVTSLSAKVPAGATSGPITVTTVDGTATSDVYFFVAPTLTSFTPTKGPVGTEVTITGTNLAPDTTVKFNGIAATFFAVINSTTIKATVPNNMTTGKISISNTSGTATSLTNFYVEPTITSFSPTTVAIGTVVTINGTNFLGASQVKFNNATASSFTVVDDTKITATVPMGANRGHIMVTTLGGTANKLRSF